MADKILLPPQNLQAEESVIGGCLIDNTAYGKIAGLLSVSDFYSNTNKIIFNAIAQLHANGSAVDVLLVDEYLCSKGLGDKVGGLAYLGQIAADTPSAANIVHYAGLVRKKSIRRAIVETARIMHESAMDDSGDDVDSIISAAENQIFALGQQGLRGKKGFVKLREALASVVDEMTELYENPPKAGVRGLSSGFLDLDELTGGFGAGDLVLLAARPSMGKTALAMNIAEHVALNLGRPVAVFSMEMQKKSIAQRCLSSVSSTQLKSIREPWKLHDDSWKPLSAGIARLSQSPLFVDDTAALTIGALRSRAMRLATEIAAEYPDGVGMVVVDYIQLMNVDGSNSDNRNGQIEVISRGLKQLAKELNCPVLALSQLNRNCDSRPNKRPVMSDLRDSGSLEQDADLILFPYRDEVYNKESVDIGTAELIIAKQRNGPLGTVRLLFDGACVRFRNADIRYNDEL